MMVSLAFNYKFMLPTSYLLPTTVIRPHGVNLLLLLAGVILLPMKLDCRLTYLVGKGSDKCIDQLGVLGVRLLLIVEQMFN